MFGLVKSVPFSYSNISKEQPCPLAYICYCMGEVNFGCFYLLSQTWSSNLEVSPLTPRPIPMLKKIISPVSLKNIWVGSIWNYDEGSHCVVPA